VPDQAGDLFDGDAVGGHQGDEGVAQVQRRPSQRLGQPLR
jgi:hypothetical protein